MTTSHYGMGRHDQRTEVFDRVRRTSRWTATGALTAVAVIVGVVAHQIPGHSGAAGSAATGGAAAGPPAPAVGTTGSTGNTGSLGNSGNTGNTGAGQVAPAPTQRAPVAVSGGSGW